MAVKTTDVATPAAFVVAAFTPPAKDPLAPLPGAVKVTVTPLTGLFPESVTVAASCVAKAVLIAELCGVPPVAAIDAADPTVFVSAKLAGVPAPGAVAVTVYAPAVAFAVKTADVAIPAALVVAVLAPPAKDPLAPLPGAVNVTRTPLTGLFPASVTLAARADGKAVLIAALCGVPPVGATAEAEPTVLVNA